MKKISCLIIPLAVVLCFVSCTKGFEEKNQNPYAITTIDPGLLFTGAERGMNIGSWDGEQTIVQQYINAYNAGATAGFQFNLDIDGYNNAIVGVFTQVLSNLWYKSSALLKMTRLTKTCITWSGYGKRLRL